jgi:hypothetical protein
MVIANEYLPAITIDVTPPNKSAPVIAMMSAGKERFIAFWFFISHFAYRISQPS